LDFQLPKKGKSRDIGRELGEEIVCLREQKQGKKSTKVIQMRAGKKKKPLSFFKREGRETPLGRENGKNWRQS